MLCRWLNVMMNVIRICLYECPRVVECPPLLICTSSSCHWCPHRNNIPSTRWYYLYLHAIRSTSALSSNGDWFSRNILIGCIQSYVGSYSSSSITIRFGSISSLVGSVGLTEGLDKFSIMTSSEIGALEEAIHARWSASWLSNHGTYQTSNPSKNFSIMCTYARYSVIFSLL
jgi:hypothetical protein